jgi:diguanylate cyclase (GGDEF)-like protein
VNPVADSWAAQQLTEYLTQLGASEEVCSALKTGVERAAEAFEAEAGAVVRDGAVVATIGFPQHESPPAGWGRPAIVEGAQALTGDEVVALRLLDDADPAVTRLVASTGLDPETQRRVRSGRVGEGAGGVSIATDRLTVLEDYAVDGRANPGLAAEGLHAAMSAPVWRNGVVCGSLTVASRRRDRRYGDDEREVLVAFAEHASLALTDTRNHSDAVHRALHDPLTNLPNRTLFLDRLRQAEERAARSGGCVGVLFLDLDGFKTVNDSLGHGLGDELLVGVARRLESVLRAGDTAARLGGDEFAILVEDLDADRQAVIVADRIMAALRAPFTIGGQEVAARASIGVATAGGPGSDLLRDADLAMYQAKADGRDRIVGFNGDMHAAMVERMALEGDLRRALERGELSLTFQPIVDLADGRALAAEALLRWHHPQRGSVSHRHAQDPQVVRRRAGHRPRPGRHGAGDPRPRPQVRAPGDRGGHRGRRPARPADRARLPRRAGLPLRPPAGAARAGAARGSARASGVTGRRRRCDQPGGLAPELGLLSACPLCVSPLTHQLPLDKPPVVISHSSYEIEAHEARRALAQALRDAGFEPLVDDDLVPGVEWHREIRSWLGRCWAAVILFSPHALKSEHVRSEVEILMHRRMRLGNDFPVVPVVVGKARPASLSTKRWRPSEVAALDVFRWGRDPVERIIERLEPIRTLFEASPYQNLDLRLVRELKPIDDDIVKNAARHLDMAPTDWEEGASVKLVFARRLLDAGYEQQLRAVRVLVDADPAVGRTVYRRCAPWSWIDAEAGDYVRTHSYPRSELECLGIESTSATTCERYVQRADWRWTSRDIDTRFSETWIEDIVRSAHEALCEALNRPLSTAKETVAADLERATRNVFLRLPADVATGKVVKSLRESYRSLGIVVLGADSEVPEHPDAIVKVHPPLDPMRESQLAAADERIEDDITRLERV